MVDSTSPSNGTEHVCTAGAEYHGSPHRHCIWTHDRPCGLLTNLTETSNNCVHTHCERRTKRMIVSSSLKWFIIVILRIFIIVLISPLPLMRPPITSAQPTDHVTGSSNVMSDITTAPVPHQSPRHHISKLVWLQIPKAFNHCLSCPHG